jgi:hypothetical protein
MLISCLLYMCTSMCISCNTEETVIEKYFSKSKEILDEQELFNLKIKKEGELIEYICFGLERKVFDEIYDKQLDSLLNANEIVSNNKEIPFFIMLHEHLNNEKIDYNKIEEILSNYRKAVEANEIERLKENEKKAQEVYNNHIIGDTVCLVVLYEKKPRGVYYMRMQQNNVNYNIFDKEEKIIVQGIIINKIKEKSHDSKQKHDYSFNLQLLNEDEFGILETFQVVSPFGIYLNQSFEEIFNCNDLIL